MSACNVEAIKLVGKYLNSSVGSVCYNTDKVNFLSFFFAQNFPLPCFLKITITIALTAVLDKQNVEGFATIVLWLASKSGVQMSQEQLLNSYQWLEHISMYSNQAATNPTFAKSFLQDINKALEKNTYLTGQFLNVTDVAAYYVLYPLIERLSVTERESLLHVCRWSKHIQSQPQVCTSKPPLHLNTLTLSVLAPAVH
ncbi:eukaryotic translation elongation factor 1 epsilon-1 isoform X2 [Plodia interpunctella]|uniref:eukaryotic translation elongation factor 1 epsilon-1 isoform X2 n=1 Tax=Plodia interpunctella TaxID=58824 RepID=UPI002368A5A2|nr:eukaryotic translation elongation factor 1 epsilon-1 isoform X2 [Plodia interpunctella]